MLYGNIIFIKKSGGDGSKFPVTQKSLKIGRSEDCLIRIQNAYVSNEHCQIIVDDNGQVKIKNLSTTNSTVLNDQPLGSSEVPLRHGDIFKLGDRHARWEYLPNSKYFHQTSPARLVAVVVPQQRSESLSRGAASTPNGSLSSSIKKRFSEKISGTGGGSAKKQAVRKSLSSKSSTPIAGKLFAGRHSLQAKKMLFNVQTQQRKSTIGIASTSRTPKSESVEKIRTPIQTSWRVKIITPPSGGKSKSPSKRKSTPTVLKRKSTPIKTPLPRKSAVERFVKSIGKSTAKAPSLNTILETSPTLKVKSASPGVTNPKNTPGRGKTPRKTPGKKSTPRTSSGGKAQKSKTPSSARKVPASNATPSGKKARKSLAEAFTPQQTARLELLNELVPRNKSVRKSDETSKTPKRKHSKANTPAKSISDVTIKTPKLRSPIKSPKGKQATPKKSTPGVSRKLSLKLHKVSTPVSPRKISPTKALVSASKTLRSPSTPTPKASPGKKTPTPRKSTPVSPRSSPVSRDRTPSPKKTPAKTPDLKSPKPTSVKKPSSPRKTPQKPGDSVSPRGRSHTITPKSEIKPSGSSPDGSEKNSSARRASEKSLSPSRVGSPETKAASPGRRASRKSTSPKLSPAVSPRRVSPQKQIRSPTRVASGTTPKKVATPVKTPSKNVSPGRTSSSERSTRKISVAENVRKTPARRSVKEATPKLSTPSKTPKMATPRGLKRKLSPALYSAERAAKKLKISAPIRPDKNKKAALLVLGKATRKQKAPPNIDVIMKQKIVKRAIKQITKPKNTKGKVLAATRKLRSDPAAFPRTEITPPTPTDEVATKATSRSPASRMSPLKDTHSSRKTSEVSFSSRKSEEQKSPRKNSPAKKPPSPKKATSTPTVGSPAKSPLKVSSPTKKKDSLSSSTPLKHSGTGRSSINLTSILSNRSPENVSSSSKRRSSKRINPVNTSALPDFTELSPTALGLTPRIQSFKTPKQKNRRSASLTTPQNKGTGIMKSASTSKVKNMKSVRFSKEGSANLSFTTATTLEGTTFDFESLRTPDITTDVFVSPLGDSQRKSTRGSSRGWKGDIGGAKKSLLKADFSNLSGINSLFKTAKSPRNDLRDVRGVKELLTTKSPRNSLGNVKGVKSLFNRSPVNDLRDVRGVKRLLKTPRSPKNDLTDVRGVKQLLITRSPRNSLSNVQGVKSLFGKSPVNDLTNIRGLRTLFTAAPSSPKNDLTNVSGVRELFLLRKSVDFDVSLTGVSELFKSPERGRGGRRKQSITFERELQVSLEKLNDDVIATLDIGRSRTPKSGDKRKGALRSAKKSDIHVNFNASKESLDGFNVEKVKPRGRPRKATSKPVEVQPERTRRRKPTEEEEILPVESRTRATRKAGSSAKKNSAEKRKIQSIEVEDTNTPPKQRKTRAGKTTGETTESSEKSQSEPKRSTRTRKSVVESASPLQTRGGRGRRNITSALVKETISEEQENRAARKKITEKKSPAKTRTRKLTEETTKVEKKKAPTSRKRTTSEVPSSPVRKLRGRAKSTSQSEPSPKVQKKPGKAEKSVTESKRTGRKSEKVSPIQSRTRTLRKK